MTSRMSWFASVGVWGSLVCSCERCSQKLCQVRWQDHQELDAMINEHGHWSEQKRSSDDQHQPTRRNSFHWEHFFLLAQWNLWERDRTNLSESQNHFSSSPLCQHRVQNERVAGWSGKRAARAVSSWCHWNEDQRSEASQSTELGNRW